jgi:hypothetical protein
VFVCVCVPYYTGSYAQAQVPPTQADSPKNQAANGHIPTQTKQRDTKQTLPIVKVAPASKSDQKPKQVTEQHDSHPTPDWLLIGVTGLLVIATAGLVYYARDAARRQLRAYVFIDKAYIKDVGNPPVTAASISIKNSGQTPAYNVQHEHFVRLDDIPPGPFPAFNQDGPKCHLSPGGMMYHLVKGNGTLGAVQRMAFNKKELAFYVFGQIIYQDCFGIKRHTNYRLMQTGGDNALRYCDDGNEAD